jgi:hypothetical protein
MQADLAALDSGTQAHCPRSEARLGSSLDHEAALIDASRNR